MQARGGIIYFCSLPSPSQTPLRHRRRPYGIRCGAISDTKPREVTILVHFQNFGKCRALPVTR